MSTATDATLDKIRKLLALAERAGTERGVAAGSRADLGGARVGAQGRTMLG